MKSINAVERTRPKVEGLMSSEWVKLASAADAYQADLLVGRLRAGGITAQSMKSGGAPGAWLTGNENPFGPIDVFVPGAQLSAAREIFKEIHPASDPVTHEHDPARVPRIAGAVLIVALIGALLVVILVDAFK